MARSKLQQVFFQIASKRGINLLESEKYMLKKMEESLDSDPSKLRDSISKLREIKEARLGFASQDWRDLEKELRLNLG